MEEPFRNIQIFYNDAEGNTSVLYANVSEAQYELIASPGNYPDDTVLTIYGQLTPEGEMYPRIMKLEWVTGFDLWEPSPDSGLARLWPHRL